MATNPLLRSSHVPGSPANPDLKAVLKGLAELRKCPGMNETSYPTGAPYREILEDCIVDVRAAARVLHINRR